MTAVREHDLWYTERPGGPHTQQGPGGARPVARAVVLGHGQPHAGQQAEPVSLSKQWAVRPCQSFQLALSRGPGLPAGGMTKAHLDERGADRGAADVDAALGRPGPEKLPHIVSQRGVCTQHARVGLHQDGCRLCQGEPPAVQQSCPAGQHKCNLGEPSCTQLWHQCAGAQLQLTIVQHGECYAAFTLCSLCRGAQLLCTSVQQGLGL